MNVLAFDTCLGAISVAIGRAGADGRLTVSEAYEEIATGHAERLVPLVGQEMARAGLGFADLDRIAVTLGPGTFTGVRTGIAAARAFRLAAGTEVVGLTSLAVIAHRIFTASPTGGDDRPLLIALDARRGRLYVQLFGSSALDPLTEALEVTAGEAVALGGVRPTRLAGSGARAIGEAAGGGSMEVVAQRGEPHAADLAALAPQLTPLRDIAPLYIRAPDAKPQDHSRLPRTR